MGKVNNIFNYQLALCVLFTVACNSDVSIKKNLISGSDYKLWQEVKDAKKSKGSSIIYWYFDREGKFKLYVKYKNANKIVNLDLGDVVLT